MGSVAYEAEMEVPLAIDAAFDAFTDPAHFHEWQRAVKRVTDLQGAPSQPGSTYVLDHGIGGKLRATVLAAERPTLYRFRQEGLGSDMTVSVQFTEVDAFRSRIHATIELATGRFSRFFSPPRGLARRALLDELNQFRKWVERTRPSPRDHASC